MTAREETCLVCFNHRLGSSCASLAGLVYRGMKVIDDARVVSVASSSVANELNVAGDAQREGRFDHADEIMRNIIATTHLSVLPIEMLCPLPVNAIRAIKNEHIDTISALITRTPFEIGPFPEHATGQKDRWYNFGQAMRSRLGERMRDLGINLAMGDRMDYTWFKPLSRLRATRQAWRPLAQSAAISRRHRVLKLPTFVYGCAGCASGDCGLSEEKKTGAAT